jgi:probable DNA repair protein
MPTTETAAMLRGLRIDEWLRDGGVVVASSERTAHAIRGAYNRRRIKEGLSAWESPKIFEWKTFVRNEWDERLADHRMVLSAQQEDWVWARIAAESEQAATVLHGPRYRLASMAREAHDLLCSYAPNLLDSEERTGWFGDPEVFSDWVTHFDDHCSGQGLISAARLSLELIEYLKGKSDEIRPSLLLVGYDRVQPTQTAFFEAWGGYEFLTEESTATLPTYYSADDAGSELAACILWCRSRLESDPKSRLLVVSQDASLRRGEIERAFTRYLDPSSGEKSPIEFSLGVTISQVPLVRGALILLRWLTKPIAEHELDWLLSSNLTAESESETAGLLRYMRLIRKCQQQRPEWTIEAFLNCCPRGHQPPQGWARRLISAVRMLDSQGKRQQLLEWSELVPNILKEVGWPGFQPMTSANYQALQHWNRTLDVCGTLSFDGVPTSWSVFHSALARNLEDVLFAPESTDANIFIAAPAQSAGLSPDGIWFLGAEEDSWPLTGTVHPFIPPMVQKDAGMPHSSTQLDSDLSRVITTRLLHAAPEVIFSHARMRAKAEANPSHMVMEVAGQPKELPAAFVPDTSVVMCSLSYQDTSRIPLSGSKAVGGSGTLTNQSQCPFRAFARFRMNAESWDRAETGLTLRQRGDLVHGVLHAVWGGPARKGWRSSAEMVSLLQSEGAEGLVTFVEGHVQTVIDQNIVAHLRGRLSERYIELEAKRLTRLVTEWLLYEATRVSFTVAKTEERTTVTIAGLTLNLRLDRLDSLQDGSSLVIDYKTGAADPSEWVLPRPEDVQLPMYSVFAVTQTQAVDPGGLLFATVQTGNTKFAGRVRQADMLLPNLSKANGLVKHPLTEQTLDEWRSAIEQLARDFLAGEASVDPKDYPSTCEHCSLTALCRIGENRQNG